MPHRLLHFGVGLIRSGIPVISRPLPLRPRLAPAPRRHRPVVPADHRYRNWPPAPAYGPSQKIPGRRFCSSYPGFILYRSVQARGYLKYPETTSSISLCWASTGFHSDRCARIPSLRRSASSTTSLPWISHGGGADRAQPVTPAKAETQANSYLLQALFGTICQLTSKSASASRFFIALRVNSRPWHYEPGCHPTR